MKVVIVCESMFGNTERLAREVRDGLATRGIDVSLIGVRDATSADLDGSDLLVVAAPTHALSLSRPESRAQAVEKGADPARAVVGVREWLPVLEDLLPDVSRRPPAAVFDTRVLSAKHWPGSAAHRAARVLRREGFTVVDQVSFFVDGIAGPISSGEEQRAHEWGTGLAESLVASRWHTRC